MSALDLTYLGTATLALRAGETRLLTDPAFDPRGSKYDFGLWFTPRSWFASEKLYTSPEVPTGLFFVDTKSRDMHDISGTTDVPLSQLPYEKLCPGSAALDELQKSFR